MTDLIQILLQQRFDVLLIITTAFVLLFMQAVKAFFVSTRLAVSFSRSILLRLNAANLAICIVLVTAIIATKSQIVNALQYIEQVYINPTFDQGDTPDIEAHYKRALWSKVSPEQYNYIVAQTVEQAAKYGTTPLNIYRVALSECAMNPFALNRKDGRVLAAGWIQFTNAGLEYLSLDGRCVSLPDVVGFCNQSRIAPIMQLTDQYFCTRLKGKQMTTRVDVYMCVFAPAFVGASENTVLYEGYNNPAYYHNSTFDGYKVRDGKILHLASDKDGKITVGEVSLHLKMKESLFLKGAATRG